MSRTYYLYRGSEGSESLHIWSLLQIRLDEQSECAARALSAKGVFSPLGRRVLISLRSNDYCFAIFKSLIFFLFSCIYEKVFVILQRKMF